VHLNKIFFYSSQNFYHTSYGRVSAGLLVSQNLPPIRSQVTHTDTLNLQFHSETWPDKTVQTWVEIPKLMVGVRHCAKRITSFCWIKPLTDDGVVATPAMPQNINCYGHLFDNKKEKKTRSFVCLCAHLTGE